MDYFDKWLIVLSVTTSSISIETFATTIGVPVGIASASFKFIKKTSIIVKNNKI